MRHAILGVGGVGGLVGGGLARAGDSVVLLVRPASLADYPARLRVESVVLGDFEVDVERASALDREVDVLWVTPKAPQLAAALELAPRDHVGDATVVPLLNGVDHVALLRERYAHVLAGAIRVESERVRPGLVRQRTQIARVDLAPGRRREEIADELRTAGFGVALAPDEATLLWEKMSFLAPFALATTAHGGSVGVVQSDPEWMSLIEECHGEAVAVGLAEGADLDRRVVRRVIDSPGGEMRTSMQKDFDAGLPLELDAVAGPILRYGRRHSIPTPATAELVSRVEARLAGNRRDGGGPAGSR